MKTLLAAGVLWAGVAFADPWAKYEAATVQAQLDYFTATRPALIAFLGGLISGAEYYRITAPARAAYDVTVARARTP